MRASWRWPRVRGRTALVVLAGATGFGLWQASTVLLAMRADGDDTPWHEPFFWELTGALAAAACLWFPAVAWVNTPRPLRLVPTLGLHAAAFVGFTIAKNALMLGARFSLYPLLGWGSYHYPALRVHLAMEVMKDARGYVALVVGYGLYRAWRERQALALRESQLASELKDAQLRALLGQLEPHFLFNALNTVSATMYEDLERTDRLLADLGQVLRAGLDADRPTWSLADERAHTARYFAVLHARFGARLGLTWQVEPGLERTAIPRFALQLLVENAAKHNQDRTEPLAITIHARRDHDALVVDVDDDGRGFDAPTTTPGAGVGLRHLTHALALLHGDRARLERTASPAGGARVRLVVPAEPA